MLSVMKKSQHKGCYLNKSIEIDDTRQFVYARDFYRCQYKDCTVRGWDNLQMAHRIRKGRTDYVRNFWRDKWGIYISLKQAKDILNHPLNLITSCPLHNQLFLIDNEPIESDELLEKIKETMYD